MNDYEKHKNIIKSHMADLVRSDTNGSSKARICSEIAYHEGYIQAILDNPPKPKDEMEEIFIENTIEKLIDNHADGMSNDNPENHWWYADHLESLADDIKHLLDSFHGVRK